MSEHVKPGVTITPKPDGPYVVRHLERLSNRAGPIETKPAIALCRCGGSATKPFCDRTHLAIGFSSAKGEPRAPDRRDDYRGDGITIHDNRGVCAHAALCTDGLPSVFRIREEPWIDPAGASRDEIVATVRQCPSGALTLSLDRGSLPPETVAEPAIFVATNGPYHVTGPAVLVDTVFGAGAPPDRFALCRCGGSQNKPFCDGTHWSNGFTDEKN